jgi:hypothetical protein
MTLGRLFLFLTLLAGCCLQKPPVEPSPFEGISFDSTYTNGLTSAERATYYSMDEGIQYLPTDVLMALNRPTGSGVGLYDELLLAKPERLGLIPNYVSPGGIPVGITSSRDPEYVPMAGLNCSTCHTSMLLVGKKAIVIDGGTSLFAIDRFIKEMVLSVLGTLANPVAFKDFYARYKSRVAARSKSFGASVNSAPDLELEGFLGSNDYNDLSAALQANDLKLQIKLEEFEKKAAMKAPLGAAHKATTLTSAAYPTQAELGSGIKMFVYLVRRFQFFYAQTKFASNPTGSTAADSGLGRANPWSVTKNMLATNLNHTSQANWPKEVGGPVNTPVIWGFDRSQFIFWTGVTNSMLERNLAQGVALVTDFNWTTYETTVSVKKLEAVSAFARKTVAPKWPEQLLGPIDQEKAAAGRAIFEAQCLTCHDPKASTEGPGSTAFNYRDVQTDQEYYKGQVAPLDGKDLFTEVLAPFLSKVKQGVMTREGITDQEAYQKGRLPSVWRAPKGNNFLARPLQGIWASPPFLHNGSVASIRELLSEIRLAEISVGNLQYDPVNLGFQVGTPYYGSTLKVRCASGCTGNDNQGHNYGVKLSSADKDALIEFLKSY